MTIYLIDQIEFSKLMIIKTLIYIKQYLTDLTESLWRLIEGILKDNRKHSIREIFNATFYLSKTGCQWRMLPNDFPKW